MTVMRVEIIIAMDLIKGDIILGPESVLGSVVPHEVEDPHMPTKQDTRYQCIGFVGGTGIAVLPTQALQVALKDR